VMSLMSTYGTLEPIGKVSMRNWLVQGTKRQKQVIYTEVIHNHYQFRHAVDYHNTKRHSPISLEVVWATKWWPNRVFAFILSVTEVNAMLAYKQFCKEEVDGMLGFRKLLAEALVCNPYYKEEVESPRRSSRLTKNAEHRVFRLPKGKKFFGTEVVDADSSHPQSTCVDCKRKTRTCCICSMDVYRCVDCCLHHSMEAVVLSPSSPG
jgi:hypothetical protein